jgi:hypothetical protein
MTTSNPDDRLHRLAGQHGFRLERNGDRYSLTEIATGESVVIPCGSGPRQTHLLSLDFVETFLDDAKAAHAYRLMQEQKLKDDYRAGKLSLERSAAMRALEEKKAREGEGKSDSA